MRRPPVASHKPGTSVTSGSTANQALHLGEGRRHDLERHHPCVHELLGMRVDHRDQHGMLSKAQRLDARADLVQRPTHHVERRLRPHLPT